MVNWVTYRNANGNSSVWRWAIYASYIWIKFRNKATTARGEGENYRYSYTSAGINNVEYMKDLAKNGRGLNSFINRVVADNYDSHVEAP